MQKKTTTKKISPKKNTAFLSFATEDAQLVECLKEVFNALGHTVFFSKTDIGEAGSPEWRKEIIKQIKRSSTFIPIYTRYSIQRPWVLYESGVADSSGLARARFPVRVSSVSISEIAENPRAGSDPLVYDLFLETSVRNFFRCVCGHHRKTTGLETARNIDDAKLHTDDPVNKVINELVKKIVNLSKTRWAFVAGNTPTNLDQLKKDVPWALSKEQYEAKLKDFVIALTETLIEEGFSVSACPQVESVGMHVIATAAHKVSANSLGECVDYRLGGIHPVDQFLRAKNLQLSDSAIKHWREHIKDFRKYYLRDQEWLVLLGGNEGTREEADAAKECGVKVMPVPCFGGTAKNIWEEAAPKKMKHQCGSCVVNGDANRECIKEIVRYMKEKAGSDENA
jgi:hypothetical protein